MAEGILSAIRPSSGSPPPNCAICLGTCTNKCFSDSCMHEFCYKCLLEWSKIKAECPLCKQTFKTIIYNIKSLNEYDEHHVETIPVEDHNFLDASYIYLPPGSPPGNHQYHFRTTFTVDTHGEHAIQQMLLSHPLITIGTFAPERFAFRRRRGDTSTTFRRTVYNENLWVNPQPDFTGRFRDISPHFYRDNPAARTRLVPWLNRELNALLYENTQQVMHLVDVIMDHLLRHHICGLAFRTLLTEYLGIKTDHFIHEFYNFMRSPYDMIGYDRHITYDTRPRSPIPLIDVSDYDSDVILVSSPTNNNNNNTIPDQVVTRRTDPVVIDLIDTDSDEPILVSEQQGESHVIQTDGEESQNHREPLLPLKLRIKNKRKSKESHARGRKRSRQLLSSSGSSYSSLSSDSYSDSDYPYTRRHYPKKVVKKVKKEKSRSKRNVAHQSQTVPKVPKVAEDTSEDELPLSNYTVKRKRSKHSDKKSKSHTVTSSFKEDQRRSEASGSSSNPSQSSSISTTDRYGDRYQTVTVSMKNEPSSCRFPESSGSSRFNMPISLTVKTYETRGNSSGDTNSDENLYNELKVQVKSKIQEVTNDDRLQNAGPSSGRLRSILKKEEQSNLWYSRPCKYESDSSEN